LVHPIQPRAPHLHRKPLRAARGPGGSRLSDAARPLRTGAWPGAPAHRIRDAAPERRAGSNHQQRSLMFVKTANLVLTVPWAVRLVWRWSYNKFSKTDLGWNWDFMNFGYVWPDSEKPPVLDPKDEPDRLCIQLYHRLASEVDVRDRSILEVGCGRGG